MQSQRKKFADSGVLFSQQAQGNQPNATGTIDLCEATVRALVENLDNGFSTLRIAAWKKQSPRGGSFLSIKASIPKEAAEKRAAADAAMGKAMAQAQGYGGKKSEPDDGEDIPF